MKEPPNFYGLTFVQVISYHMERQFTTPARQGTSAQLEGPAVLLQILELLRLCRLLVLLGLVVAHFWLAPSSARQVSRDRVQYI